MMYLTLIPREMERNEEFELKFVHRFYSRKAREFSETRRQPWPFTVEFIRSYTTPSSLVLDSGCGNGRTFIHPNTVGLDYSAELLRDSQKHTNLSVLRADVNSLPFKDGCFDIVLSIAVIHHICTRERRIQVLREMKRVLKPGGYCLVYAWHKNVGEQKKFKVIDDDEYFVSWKGEQDNLRYYVLFDEDELKELSEKSGFEVETVKKEQESVYAVLKSPCKN